jgi:hypothetical protein
MYYRRVKKTSRCQDTLQEKFLLPICVQVRNIEAGLARLNVSHLNTNWYAESYGSIFVPNTYRNLAIQAGLAGQAGAVTRLPSAVA